MKRMDVVVIGNTGLCLECCNRLLLSNHKIIAIVSEDTILKQWSLEQDIKCIDYNQYKEADFKNYLLFSIVNPNIIPSSLLERHQVKLAVNYHDSLLPTYAGVNSTTWAILNNEQYHGVTWHKMNDGIDEGDILKQTKINIGPNETVNSLNLKCTDNSLVLFDQLLAEIDNNDLKPLRQLTGDKSYYGLDSIPPNNGIVNQCQNIETLYSYCRALGFCYSYDNPVGTAKIIIENQVYLLSVPEILDANDHCRKQGLYIIGVPYSLYFNQLTNAYGQKVSFDENIHFDELVKSEVAQSKKILDELEKVKRCERTTLTRLKQYDGFDGIAFDSVKKSSGELQLLLTTANLTDDNVLTIIALVLSRILQKTALLTVYPTTSGNVFTDNKCFIVLNDETCNESLIGYQEKIKQCIAQSFHLSKDFLYRYNRMDLLTELAIYSEERLHDVNPHRLSFIIGKDQVIIKGYEKDSLIIEALSSTLKVMMRNYAELLEQTTPVNRINLLSDAQYQQIVVDWNKVDVVDERNKTIHEVFEAQVQKTPDNVAVAFDSQQLTYQELNSKANQLARYLKQHYTLVPDTLVAVCLDRGVDMIIAILGIFKAGAAYVPIDPEYPSDRINYILKDSQTTLMLSQSLWVNKLQKLSPVALVDLDLISYIDESNTNLKEKSESSHLAYVIYTSGTTGKPNGVMVEHKSLINFSKNIICSFGIISGDVVMQLASVVFDASVLEIFPAITSGAQLSIVPEDVKRDTAQLVDYFDKKGINVAFMSPALLGAMDYRPLPKLKTLIVGGESCGQELMNLWCQGRQLINAYGPTEVTVMASLHYFCAGEHNNIIGKGLKNTCLYVLDEQLNPLPIGVVGHLYVGGVGLCRGYLNRVELTQQKFVANPFSTADDILYKTGDLVRYRPDGSLVFIGRNDCQVKIRGYRIELGEIEDTLAELSAIKQCCILAQEKNGNQYLVAYYVTNANISTNDLTEQLLQKLPKHMVPHTFVQLQSMPLTVNGKLDKKALPAPDFYADEEYVSPSNDIEKKLCFIWESLLKLEKVGVMSDFFALGGNSILAIKLAHKIAKTLAVNITVADIFNLKTVQAQSTYIANNNKKQIIITAQQQAYYPLSFAQERLLFIEQYEQGTNAYHVPLMIELQQGVDLHKLEKVIQRLVNRHQVLNTVFKQEKGEFFQQVLDTPLDINQYYDETIDLDRQLDLDINKFFDLQRFGPVRISFYHALNNTRLLINVHHIAFDGWSSDILLKEIHDLYNDKALDMLDIQYKDFALWQRSYLQGELLQQQVDYWKSKLEGFQPLVLPCDKPRPKNMDYNGENISFNFGELLSDNLRILSKQQNCSLYVTLLSGFYLLLSKYTAQDDIVLGSPIANRHYTQLQDVVGFFVNTLALRETIDGQKNVRSLLAQVQNSLAQAQAYQDLPFEKVVEALNVDHDPSRHPIFQVIFSLQSFASQIDNNVFKGAALSEQYTVAKYDLSCFIDDSQSDLHGELNFATALYHRETISDMISHYKVVLQQMVTEPNKLLKNYQLLTDIQYQQQVINWNKTHTAYSADKTIYQLFEQQVLKTPNQNAAFFSGQHISYTQLNNKANQLARYLQEILTIKPDTIIALCVDRNIDMLIGILGVLKAGAAYVPIDPQYPVERIQYIVQDTQTALILTQSDLIKPLQQSTQVSLLLLDSDIYHQQQTSNLPPKNRPTDLAYVIYTSGTTGKPKGVMIGHRQLNNLAQNITEGFGITSGCKMVQLASYVFDASVLEIFSTLINGAQLWIVPNTVKQDPDLLGQYLEQHQINVAIIPPSLLGAMDYQAFEQLSTIIVAGESCPQELLDKWSQNRRLINGYGPSECSVCATLHQHDKGEINTNIGQPMPNASVYVVDEHMNNVPVGIIGELLIGGAGLSMGYLNQTELTEQKFIANPFATDQDRAQGFTRLYKTGDLVRWLPGGDLEFIGRNDFQVKIRGFRIELEEIEQALSEIEGIKQSCVQVLQNKSNKYLAAYFIADSTIIDKDVSEHSISEKLSTRLLPYMIPAVYVRIDNFPLTINGKLDRKSLPQPEFTLDNEEYELLESALELKIGEIYATVLAIPVASISRTQSFFKMGGNSILCMKLKQEMAQLTEFSTITVADLFKYYSIEKLIDSLGNDHQNIYHQQRLNHSNEHEIAIIGVSGAFSGADNTAQFWQLIANQEEGLTLYDKQQCLQFGVDEQLLSDPDFVAVAGKISGVDLFDPVFWQMSPNEAKELDPQIRKFVEHCWHVLELSGYAQQRKSLSVGVFAGSGTATYFNENILQGEASEHIDLWQATQANNKDALATKAAYLLGLTGPANSVNTGCSTSLLTIAEACKNLQLGVCDMALAGGVSLGMPDHIGYRYQPGMILSKNGQCRTFDQAATGVVPGSGVGVVLLKPVAQAIIDQDEIIGIIKGYATNNDGDRKSNYTAPSVIGQSECIINAQKMAGIVANDLDYIECHGTATSLGDPIEIQALKEAFEYNADKAGHFDDKCLLGAVKANIGHADSAAGVAGFMKVCGMLVNQVLPAQVNFESPNPELQLQSTPFEIALENRPWLVDNNKQRLAGVSSFGIGGTNAHVIIGDYYNNQRVTGLTLEKLPTNHPYVFTLSAKTPSALQKYRQALLNYLVESEYQNERLADLAYTLEQRRESFDYRCAYHAKSVTELTTKLQEHSNSICVEKEMFAKSIFMYPGQGTQYQGMAQELYENELQFKVLVDRCISIANRHLNIDLAQVIFQSVNRVDSANVDSANVDSDSIDLDKTDTDTARINNTEWAQISLFTLSYALAKYLEQLGVKAQAHIGHSIGEYVAATQAGVFSLEDAIKVVINRGRLMQSMPSGSMLAIHGESCQLISQIASCQCEIAVINSRQDIVVSGEDGAINRLKVLLSQQDIITTKLNTSHAYHSHMMTKAASLFKDVFTDIELKAPKSHSYISNLTGDWADETVTTSEYWCQQLRHTVEFSQGIETLCKNFDQPLIFIEIGMGKGLSSFVNSYVKQTQLASVHTLPLMPSLNQSKKRAIDKIDSKAAILALLWQYQLIAKANEGDMFSQCRNLTDLPGYQFDQKKCWLSKNKVVSADKISKNNANHQMCHERVWQRNQAFNRLFPVNTEQSKTCERVLLLINDNFTPQGILHTLVESLRKKIGAVYYVVNGGINNLQPNICFDFSEEVHFQQSINGAMTDNNIDTVMYFSSKTDVLNSAIDVLAITSLFRNVGQVPSRFVSVSFDNYEVLGNEDLQAQPAVVYAVTKSLPFEFPKQALSVLHADLSSDALEHKDLLYRLLVNTYESDLLVLRGAYSWLHTFKQVSLPTPMMHNPVQGKVILITGGLGGVGYGYAQHVVEQGNNTIILLGRSSLSSLNARAEQRLSELKNSLSSIVYIDMDIALESKESLRDVLLSNGIERLDMVLHAAGQAAKSAIESKNSQDFNAVINPKIKGVDTLIALSQYIPIDRFINCSSLASLLPSLGNMEYTVANLYLDEICYRRHEYINQMLTVNLNQLSDTGMAVDFMAKMISPPAIHSDSITSTELPLLFDVMFTHFEQQNIAISRGSLNETIEANFMCSASSAEYISEPTTTFVIVDTDYSTNEFKVAGLFCDILGVSEISLNDDFFKLGGNSMAAIKLSHQLEKVLSIPVDITDVFKFTTIKELAGNLTVNEPITNNEVWEL